MKLEWCLTASFSRGPKPDFRTMHPADASLASCESHQAVTALTQTRLIFSFAFLLIHGFNLHVSNCSASQGRAEVQDRLLRQQKQGRALGVWQGGEVAAGLRSVWRSLEFAPQTELTASTDFISSLLQSRARGITWPKETCWGDPTWEEKPSSPPPGLDQIAL